MADQGFFISDLPAVATPATELPGALFEVEALAGPVAGAYVNKKLTIEQFAAYLGAAVQLTLPQAQALLSAGAVASGRLYLISGFPGSQPVAVMGLATGYFASQGYVLNPAANTADPVAVDVRGGTATPVAGQRLNELVLPQAVIAGRWYLTATGVWEASTSGNATTAPVAGPNWRAVVGFASSFAGLTGAPADNPALAAALAAAGPDPTIAKRLGKTTVSNNAAPISLVANRSPALAALYTALQNTTTQAVNIVFLGTSTVWGAGASSPAAKAVNTFTRKIQAVYPALNRVETDVSFDPNQNFGQQSGTGVKVYNGGLLTGPNSNQLLVNPTAIGALNPRMVLFQNLTVDWYNNIDPATCKAQMLANINTLVAARTAPTPCVFVLVLPYGRFDTPVENQTYPLSMYAEICNQIAAERTDTVALITMNDFAALSIPGSDPLNLVESGHLHLVDAGHAFTANLWYRGIGLSNAVTSTPYTLQVASATVLGGVKQGSGVTIAADGTISAATGGSSAPTATQVQAVLDPASNVTSTVSSAGLKLTAPSSGGTTITENTAGFYTATSSASIAKYGSAPLSIHQVLEILAARPNSIAANSSTPS